MKILVVDDSNIALRHELLILQKGPYELITARNGKEAVDVTKESRPDLVLMDVVMPEMNGFDAVRAIRADQEIQDTPIIMVTTRGDPAQVEEGYAAGCSDFVTKPVDGPELLSKIRSILGLEAGQ